MVELRLYDTRTRELSVFAPREPGRVGIYVCGPTVYARIHIGNARPFVVFSLFKRFLEHAGYAVTLVINVTDVNDKIYAAAGGGSSVELAEAMTAAYVADTDRLELGPADRAARPLRLADVTQREFSVHGHCCPASGYRAGQRPCRPSPGPISHYPQT